jgi:hypothetical protein
MSARFSAAAAALTAALVLVLGVAFTQVRTPAWQSRGLIAVTPASQDPRTLASVVGSFNASGAIGTYVELAASADTKRLAGVPGGVSVAARAIPDSRVIDVRTEGPRDTVRSSLASILSTTVRRQGELNDAWRLNVLQTAQPATVSGPSTTALLVATVLLALLAAVFVWIVLRRFLPTWLNPSQRERAVTESTLRPRASSSRVLEEAAADRT